MEKIDDRSARVLIIGAGYVGLPLAVRCAEEGFKTYIYDIDKKKVEQINKGVSYIGDVPSEQLKPLVDNGTLLALGSLSRFRGFAEEENIAPTPDGGNYVLEYSVNDIADIILVCVPTPLNKTKDPDVTYAVSAAQELNHNVLFQTKNKEESKLIVLESTVYPGFTNEVFREYLFGGYYQADRHHLAFSPERVDPGNDFFGVKNTAKIVGGISDESTKLAGAFYRQIIDEVVEVSSTEAAEMTKILENTFRMINIGLANETALICKELGLDVWEIIEAAKTKPFGFMPFYPGPGVGGHCIPIDPHYLSWKLKTINYHAKFIELAGEINSSMPAKVVQMVGDSLNSIQRSIKLSNILVVGVAYKPDIDDVRESPALDIIEMLQQKGGVVRYYDPHVREIRLSDGCGMESVKEIPSSHCAIIVTNHSSINYDEVLKRSETVVDTRNVLTKSSKVFKL
jgi:UDP-N-acetyl-D-glucosamine dehydrogenase